VSNLFVHVAKWTIFKEVVGHLAISQWMKHTHTPIYLTALCPGYQKGKSVWILLKQETMSGSGISWAICKSAPRIRQITTSAPHYSVFYWPDALPAAQPTVSKHWRQKETQNYYLQTIIRPQLHTSLPSVLWHCWLGGRKGIRPVKNWAVGCRRGYLSGAMCRLAYGPADSTATHCLLLQ